MSRFGPIATLTTNKKERYRILSLLTSETRKMLFSGCHPASYFLNARGVEFELAYWDNRPFLLARSEGYHWLPLPPEWILADRNLSAPFFDELPEWLFSLNAGRNGRIDNLPLGVSGKPSSCPRPIRQDIDRIILRESTLRAAGDHYKTHRWELNRLRRTDPAPEIRRWAEPASSNQIEEIKSRFFKMRRDKALNELEWLMVEDLERAHRIAETNWNILNLTGVILLIQGQEVAWQWLAFSESGDSAICFLECRDPEIKHLSAMMTHLVFQMFSKLDWINIGGDSGISGLARAKDQDRPGVLVPCHTQELVP